MKNIIIAIVASAAMVLPAAAQNSLSADPKSPISNFDIGNISPVLNELGVAWVEQRSPSGQTYLVANVQNMLTFVMAPMACRNADGTDCVGLQMLAVFEGNPNPQTVQAFNYRYPFASAGIDEAGDAYLSRYEIADYGMPRGNLSTSIQVFVQQVVMFAQTLNTARQTVSLEGYADDLAASQLNHQVRESLAGAQIVAKNPIDRHQEGLEDGATFVKQFLSDKTTPRNKIKNISVK